MKQRNHLTRWLWLAAVLALTAGIVWALWPKPIEVESVRVDRGPLAATAASIDGHTRVKQLFVVASPVDGELERIVLQPGDVVSPTSVVAQIWPVASRPLDPRSRSDALAAIEIARAEVARAEATEREAEVGLQHADSDRVRDDKLVASGAIPASEAEHQGHQTEMRRQALEAARAASREARAQLARANAALSPDRPRGAEPASIVRAPAAGRVLRIVRESAGPVAAGAPLVELGDPTQLEIVADLLSSDAAQVHPGAAANVTGWGGKALAARVRKVEPAAFTKVSALGLEEQRVHVILDLAEAPPPELGHAYRVDVAITVWEGSDVVRVPATALFRDGDAWAVFVIRDGRARSANVEIGASDGTFTVITRGLAAGEIVVAQPSDLIRDGTRVAPRERPATRGT